MIWWPSWPFYWPSWWPLWPFRLSWPPGWLFRIKQDPFSTTQGHTRLNSEFVYFRNPSYWDMRWLQKLPIYKKNTVSFIQTFLASIQKVNIVVQLGLNLSWGFGPKVNTKLTLENHHPHHSPPPPPKAFWRVLGKAGGKDLVCRPL